MAVLTFRHLRELQKTERESVSLSQIDAGFYAACAGCLKKSADAPDSSDAENIEPLLKSILDMRERKIVMFAIQAARTAIKPKNMVCEEESLFSSIIEAIRAHRIVLEPEAREQAQFQHQIPPQIQHGVQPDVRHQVQLQPQIQQEIPPQIQHQAQHQSAPAPPKSVPEQPQISKEQSQMQSEQSVQPIQHIRPQTPPQSPQFVDSSQNQQFPPQIQNPGFKLFLKLKAISDIPAFVAEDMKIYGPIRSGEYAEVPKKAAEVLISAKSAEAL